MWRFVLGFAVTAGSVSAQTLPLPAAVPTASAVLAQQQTMVAAMAPPASAEGRIQDANMRLQRSMGMARH